VVTREQQVKQSTQDHVRAALDAAGYTDIVEMRDSFPTPDERAQPLQKTTVSLGFQFDNGGTKMELGSDLTRRVHTIEFWTFGITDGQAQNVAYAIRAILEDNGGLIPLLKIEDPAKPVIDQLIVLDDAAITVDRQLSNDPRPWDRFVYSTRVKIEDVYYPSLVN
jgi:hypothetical protein